MEGCSIITGNSVILKPAEQFSNDAIKIGFYSEAEFLPGDEAAITGKSLCLHNDVDCVAFTGSEKLETCFTIFWTVNFRKCN